MAEVEENVEVVNEEVTIENPSADWTIDQWDAWADSLPEGRIKTDYFDKKSRGENFEYSSMTGPSITVKFEPVTQNKVQLGIEKLEEETKKDKKQESDYQAQTDIIDAQTNKTDLEIAEEKAQLRLQTISDNYNKEQAEELLAPSIPIYTSYIEQIDNIFDQVYNQNTKQDLRKKATTEVETTTVTGGETGFGEMGMGASDVVTTKSLPYTEFEQEAKTKIKKDFLRKTGKPWSGNIPEDAWKDVAIELYIKNGQTNKLESLVSDKMEYLEDEFDNWYFKGSQQYMKDVVNYKVTRTALDKYYEGKKNKAGKIIETAELKANTVGTAIQGNSAKLKEDQAELDKLEQSTTDDGLKYEEAVAEWNNFLKENPDTASYSKQQEKTFNELQNNLASAENNYKIGIEVYNTARGEYNQLLDDTKGFVRTYDILNERLNTIIEESPIDSYAQIADLVGRSYDNTDVFFSKAAATALTLGANIAELERIGAEKVLDMFGMDAENAEEVSKLLTGGNATTFFIDKTKEISEDLRGSVRKNISAGDIDSLGSLTNFMIDLFAEQAINTAVTATLGPAGLVLVSAGAAGGKMSDMKGEEFKKVLNEETGEYEKQRRKTFNPETGEYEEVRYDPWQYLLSGTIAFGAEYLTETVSLNQFRSAANIFKKGKKIAPSGSDFNFMGTKYSNTEFTVGGALFRYGKNVNKEGFAELTAEAFNNMGDKFILGKDIPLTQGLSEAYLSGAMMSGLGFQVPVVVAELRKSIASDAEVRSYNKRGLKIKGLTDRLNELMTISGPITQDKLDAIESLTKERDALLAENHKELGVNNQRMDDMDNV